MLENRSLFLSEITNLSWRTHLKVCERSECCLYFLPALREEGQNPSLTPNGYYTFSEPFAVFGPITLHIMWREWGHWLRRRVQLWTKQVLPSQSLHSVGMCYYCSSESIRVHVFLGFERGLENSRNLNFKMFFPCNITKSLLCLNRCMHSYRSQPSREVPVMSENISVI